MGKGTVPYGEHRPGVGHDDNGKTSVTAVAFAVQGKREETEVKAFHGDRVKAFDRERQTKIYRRPKAGARLSTAARWRETKRNHRR